MCPILLPEGATRKRHVLLIGKILQLGQIEVNPQFAALELVAHGNLDRKRHGIYTLVDASHDRLWVIFRARVLRQAPAHLGREGGDVDERVHLRVQLLGLILLVLPVLSGEFLLLGLDLRQGADPANEGLVTYGLA